MVDGRLKGSKSGGLETPSAIHRDFQRDTLRGNKEKGAFQITEIIPLAYIFEYVFY